MTDTSRRQFLKAVGLGGSALALGTAFAPAVSSSTATATARVAGIAAGDTVGLLQLARVWVDRRTAPLLNDFDDTHNVFDDGSVELLLWPGDEQRLRASGLRYEITDRDFIATDAARFGDGRGERPAGLARVPGVGRRHARIQRGSAITIDRHGRNGFGPARAQQRRLGDIAALFAGLGDTAQENFLDGFGVRPGAFGKRLQQTADKVDRLH